MPIPYVKKLATKHGVSIDKAEKHWKRAKAQAAKQGHGDDYAYVTGIFKHMMKESANTALQEARKIHKFTSYKKWRDAAIKHEYTIRGPFVPSIGEKTHKYSATDNRGNVQGDFETETSTGYFYVFENERAPTKKYHEDLALRNRQVRKIYKDMESKGIVKEKDFITRLVKDLGMKANQAAFWWHNMNAPLVRNKPVSPERVKHIMPDSDEPKDAVTERMVLIKSLNEEVQQVDDQKDLHRAVRKLLRGAFDHVGINKDGYFVVKSNYFYRVQAGGTPENLAKHVIALLKKSKIKIIDMESGDHWAQWPKESYFWVKFKVERDTPTEDKK